MHSPSLLPLSPSSPLPSALRRAGIPTPLSTNAHLLAARRRWLARREMKAPEVWDQDEDLLRRCWPFSVDGESNPSRHRVGSRTAVRSGVLSVRYGTILGRLFRPCRPGSAREIQTSVGTVYPKLGQCTSQFVNTGVCFIFGSLGCITSYLLRN